MASSVALSSSASTFLAAPVASAPSSFGPSHRRSFACRVSCTAQGDRKIATSIAAAAAVAFLAAGPGIESAEAKDVPLFGIKKAKQTAAKAVENAEEATSNIFDGFSLPSFSAPSVSAPKISTPEDKLTKAGAVVAADVVALLVASSVVSGLLKPSS